MDTRKIKEQIGRIKIYSSKNETVRALDAAISAFKLILKSGTPPATDIRGLIHENIPFILQDPLVKKYMEQPLTYKPGEEKYLLSTFTEIQKKIVEEQEKESYLETRARKQNLDKAFNLGIKLLEQQKITEAEAAFTEALTFYHDEHRLFSLIAKALIKANEHIRAIDYIKKGLEHIPGDTDLKHIGSIISRIKDGDQTAINDL